jgi:hypothetical protein
MPFLGKVPSQIVDSDVDIDGGTIDGATIGSITAGAGTFTNLSATGTITFPDDGISGDDINGGTISNVAISGTTASFSGDLTVDTDTLYVDSTNNRVGIGTTPSGKLHVDNTAATHNVAIFNNQNASYNTDITLNHSSATGNFIVSRRANGEAWLYQSAAQPIAFFTSSAERMRIDSSGNVGIGTTNPSPKFHVADVNGGGARIDGGSVTSGESAYLWFQSGRARFGYDGGRAAVAISDYNQNGTTTGKPICFDTNGSERMRIDSSGNLLVGKTSGASSIRTQFVGASSTSSNSVMLLENSSLTDLFEVRCDGRIMTGTATASPYNQTVSFGANLWINSSGVLYRTTSSLRYKENIQDMTFGLSEVLALRPVTFEQKNENTGRKFGGFIAEEVHEAGLVDFVEYNEENEPDAISYGNMVSLLTKAIQEQQAIIDSQASAIADLTTRLEALEAN